MLNNNRVFNIDQLLDPTAATPPTSHVTAEKSITPTNVPISTKNGVGGLNPLSSGNVGVDSIDEITRMDIGEFQEIGLLQEINRLFLHPMGLALEILINDNDGSKSLGGIWDYRHDPEGLLFDNEVLSNPAFLRKANDVQKMVLPERKNLLGYVVQPLPDPPKSQQS